MTTPLQLASGILLLFLVLMLAYLTSSLVLKLLSERLSRGALGGWFADNETSLAVSIWAAVALASYFLGPRLLMLVLGDGGW